MCLLINSSVRGCPPAKRTKMIKRGSSIGLPNSCETHSFSGSASNVTRSIPRFDDVNDWSMRVSSAVSMTHTSSPRRAFILGSIVSRSSFFGYPFANSSTRRTTFVAPVNFLTQPIAKSRLVFPFKRRSRKSLQSSFSLSKKAEKRMRLLRASSPVATSPSMLLLNVTETTTTEPQSKEGGGGKGEGEEGGREGGGGEDKEEMWFASSSKNRLFPVPGAP
mmetsp:Transcript_4025/g.6094  ORF Transcript_4025/g.6094 Transcript_4025/m.6094 type:complete len:220 (-) Transcript_4025:695-1354(-)